MDKMVWLRSVRDVNRSLTIVDYDFTVKVICIRCQSRNNHALLFQASGACGLIGASALILATLDNREKVELAVDHVVLEQPKKFEIA